MLLRLPSGAVHPPSARPSASPGCCTATGCAATPLVSAGSPLSKLPFPAVAGSESFRMFTSTNSASSMPPYVLLLTATVSTGGCTTLLSLWLSITGSSAANGSVPGCLESQLGEPQKHDW